MRCLAPLLWLAGLTVAALLWWLCSATIPMVPGVNVAQRLGMAAAWLLPTVAVMLAMIMVQMAARVRSGAVDPTTGRDAGLLVVNQRALSNTLEQFACFVPSLLALAAGIGPGHMPQVTALAVVFAVARLAFWLGYLASPTLRAPGMTATFAVNLLCCIAAVVVWWP